LCVGFLEGTFLYKLLFRCGDFGCGVGVLLGEAFYAAGGIDQLLFAGEKRVAIGTDFNVELVALHRRSRGEIVAAGAVDRDGVIVGVDTGFHGRLHSVAAGLHEGVMKMACTVVSVLSVFLGVVLVAIGSSGAPAADADLAAFNTAIRDVILKMDNAGTVALWAEEPGDR